MITDFKIFELNRNSKVSKYLRNGISAIGDYIYVNKPELFYPNGTHKRAPESASGEVTGYFPYSNWQYIFINDVTGFENHAKEEDIVCRAKTKEDLEKKMAQLRFDL